ncbi:DNA-methyltransferase [Brevibacterium aurantiacum]|nr:site-specific DNA-methyltransferase [Brevibacterium aurantiacum]
MAEMQTIAPSSVNLMLTDPPYNLGEFMKQRETNLGQMRDNFFVSAGWDNGSDIIWVDLMESLFRQSSRIMAPGGSAIVFMSILKVEAIVTIAKKYGFYYKTTGIWHKRNPMPRNMNLHYINSTECWIYFVYKKRTGTFNNNGRAVHDFIETSVTPASERKWGKHPTQKPVALMKHFIDHLTDPGEHVLDPFMGSGSTGVAAATSERKFTGIEIENTYFTIAESRINEAADG